MFPKSLLTVFAVVAFASGALAAPALSCPAVSSAAATVAVSSSAATAADVATSIAATSAAVSTSVAVTSSAASSSSTSASKSGKGKGGNAKGKGGNANGKGGNANGKGSSGAGNKDAGSSASATKAAASTTSADVVSTAAVASSAAAASSAASASSASSSSGDEQDSLTLDPSVIATGFAQDGQATPTAGQVASLTSKNNFINFCLGQTITNGQQVTAGSCNPAPMGIIASTSNMPSGKFTFPANFGTVKANTEFTVTMAISNLDTGNFVNADTNYYSAPQQVNAQGDIIGHSHVVIELLDSLNQTTPTTPAKFAFFKGVNGAAVNGVLSVDVTDGVPAGAYRMASINAAANHQPVLVAIAQHGSLDDMIYFTAE